MRGLGLLALAALTSGCIVHLERNAPGLSRVSEPPASLPVERVELPADPGERYLTLSMGAMTGGGLVFGDGFPTGRFDLGVEATLHLGDRARSHRADGSFIPFDTSRYYPDGSVGLSLGWTGLRVGADGAHVGHLYAELQGWCLDWLATAVAVGWAYDPGRRLHGPQLMISTLGVLYTRVTYLLDGEAAWTIGLLAKVPVAWVWSR